MDSDHSGNQRTSDSESDEHPRKREREDLSFDPRELTEYLASQAGFQAPQRELQGKFSSKLVTALEEIPHVFGMREENVVLRAGIRICKRYTDPSGCSKRPQCDDIHICPEFVSGNCEEASCEMGHKWNTTHNQRILETLYLDGLKSKQIVSLLKKD